MSRHNVKSGKYTDVGIDCLRSLSFPEQERRYNEIHSAEGTCDWLFEDPGYQAWINSPRGLFWIKGNPGAGKSVLMKYAYGMMKHRRLGELVVPFFMHGRGMPLQKTPLGFYRALLNALLGSFPEYLGQLTKDFDDREMRFGSYHMKRWYWSEAELQELISLVLTNGTENQPVVIFVDALDECGKESATKLLTYFRQLMVKINQQSGQVKICFSSRHYPILGLDTVPLIFVEERNDKDIRHVIKESLKDVHPKEKRQQIEKEILLKAQGGFQWAVLVATVAVEESVSGVKAEVIHDKIKTTPEALDELYTNILSGVTDLERQKVEKLFQWVLFAERPLSAQELRDALATDKGMTCTTVAELRTHEDWNDSLANFERRITHLSKGLVEFQTREIWEQYEIDGEDSDREAQFIHQSVPDYLLKSFFSCTGDLANDLTSSVAAGHCEISRSCLRYLKLKEILQGAQLSRGKLSARFPLAPYAVQFFFHHVHKAELKAKSQLDLLPLLGWEKHSKSLEELGTLWRVLDPECSHTPRGWPFTGATTLHVLVAMGAKSAFDAFLEIDDVEVDGRDADGNTPLLLAIRDGRQDMALALIRRSIEWCLHNKQLVGKAIAPRDTELQRSHFVDVDVENNDGDTPITIALAEKAGVVIFDLIEAGAELKFFGRETSLVFCAISSRNKALLTKLIEKEVGLDGAVFFAIQELSGNDDILLEEFISDLLKAEAGTSKVLEFDTDIHLNYDEDEAEQIDQDALQIASRKGLTTVVQLLLSHGVSAYSRNLHGECPLLIATLNHHQETATVLLRAAPSSVEVEDGDGNTALYWAIEDLNFDFDFDMTKTLLAEGTFTRPNPILVEAIRLISNKNASNTEEDNREVPPLIVAIREGFTEVAKALARTDSSGVNEHGTTALSYAIREGKEDVALFLIREGYASNTGKDDRGLPPLIVAIMEGFTEVARTLIRIDHSSIDCIIQYGTTALVDAIREGKEDVVLFLISEGYASNTWKDDRGLPPLIIAILEDSTKVAKALIQTKKSSIDCVDQHGTTALAYAIFKGNSEVEEALEQEMRHQDQDRENVHEQHTFIRSWVVFSMILNTDRHLFFKNGKTALMHAVLSGDAQLTEILVAQGTAHTLNLVDEGGRTALMHAVIAATPKILQILIKDSTERHLLSTETAENGGKGVLWSAIQRGDIAIVEELIVDNDGKSMLPYAVQRGDPVIVKELVPGGRMDLPAGLVAECVMFGTDRLVFLLLSTTKAVLDFPAAYHACVPKLPLSPGPRNGHIAYLRNEVAQNALDIPPIILAAVYERESIVTMLLSTGKVSLDSCIAAFSIINGLCFDGVSQGLLDYMATDMEDLPLRQ